MSNKCDTCHADIYIYIYNPWPVETENVSHGSKSDNL